MDVAVVTGAGRGLGRALARRLAERGLAVLATDLDAAAAEQTAAELGAPAWGRGLDVRDAAACRAVAGEAAERGRLAVWVNNAGVLRSEAAWEHGDEDVERMVAVNLSGVVHGCRAAVERMRPAGGRILNVASTSALAPTPGLAVYGATKHAVLAFSSSLAAELNAEGVPIAVRALCPDPIDTPMVREELDRPWMTMVLSAPRLLEPDEVAATGIELLFGRRLRAVVPAWRGALGRILFRYPRALDALLPVLRRVAERNRRRWRRRPAA